MFADPAVKIGTLPLYFHIHDAFKNSVDSPDYNRELDYGTNVMK